MGLFLTFLALMLQKGYLDQIGVEFHPELIYGIVGGPLKSPWAFLRVFLCLFSNFPSFDATERLFRSNWRISPEIDSWYCQLAYPKSEDP